MSMSPSPARVCMKPLRLALLWELRIEFKSVEDPLKDYFSILFPVLLCLSIFSKKVLYIILLKADQIFIRSIIKNVVYRLKKKKYWKFKIIIINMFH